MTRRYSWEELWQWASARQLNMSDLARLIHADRRQLYRWRDAGGVPEPAADRLAVKLGVLPGDIWPAWLEVGMALAELEDTRQRALKAARLRRWRESHPDSRERARAYRQTYYAENRAYELGRQKAYDAVRRTAS